jgi:hypothetical protein
VTTIYQALIKSGVPLASRPRPFIFAAVLVLACAMPMFSDSITGGAVTGGSALSAGGTFVDLSVPWGSVSTPVNTVGNANFGTPDLYAFAETQSYTLTSTLSADVGMTSLAAATTVNSFFVTFEPGGGGYQLIGYVDFNAPVLAIITSDNSLIASNFLGDAGISYQDPASVGLEPGDLVTIDASNPNQIDWNTSASTPGDSVRVILGTATAAPEPSSMLLAGIGFAIVATSSRRRIRSVFLGRPTENSTTVGKRRIQ